MSEVNPSATLLPLSEWNEEITSCARCSRLVEWRTEIAAVKRKSFEHETYWGKPVPYFGDPAATHLIVGLAPAAHGANRTGRMFTGDRSGDWLYRALHRAGFANQATSTHAKDGLDLSGVVICAVCHCAPPDNKPTREEMANCSSYLSRMLAYRTWQSILCLGGIAWVAVHRGFGVSAPAFGHGKVSELGTTTVVASYHPSQQNTFTGRLTEAMLDEAVRTWRG